MICPKFKKIKDSERGFSLLETAIALVVIGLVIGGVLKGRELIESARARAFLSQVAEIQMAVATFVDRYEALPGDLKNAKSLLGGSVSNGQGNGSISNENFWQHLHQAGVYPHDQGPPTKLGGSFVVISSPPGLPKGLWLQVGEDKSPVLTPLQAQTLDRKMDDGDPTKGRVRATGNDCVESNGYKISNKDASCVLYIALI